MECDCKAFHFDLLRFTVPEFTTTHPKPTKLNTKKKKNAEVHPHVKKTKKLAVNGAFHTRLMQGAADRLAAVLDKVRITAPAFPIVCNVDGEPWQDPSAIKRNLVTQLTSPVLWEQTMELLLEGDDLDERQILDIGPGSVLAGIANRMVKARDKSLPSPSIRSIQ